MTITNHMRYAAVAGATAGLLMLGVGTAAAEEPRPAPPLPAPGNYLINWYESGFPGQPPRPPDQAVIIHDCGPDCFTWDNLSTDLPGYPVRWSGFKWISDNIHAEKAIECDDGRQVATDRRWVFNAEATELYSDIEPVDCGQGPTKPGSAKANLVRQ